MNLPRVNADAAGGEGFHPGCKNGHHKLGERVHPVIRSVKKEWTTRNHAEQGKRFGGVRTRFPAFCPAVIGMPSSCRS